MAEHQDLVAEMLVLEQMGTQERQKLAKKRRLQQLKKWGQREKEWIAKERQLNKRIAHMLHEENNGLNLKQYTTYGSNPRPKKKAPTNNDKLSPSDQNPQAAALVGSMTTAGTIGSSVTTSNSSKNLIKNKSNNNTYTNNNTKAYTPKFNGEQRNGFKEPNGLAPNGRVHFNVGVMLLEAAARNDLDEVKRLLMLGVSPDSVNHDGLTALHQCCIDASETIMNLLLEFGANVDARDTEQWTPLHAACTCGHLNLVKILVEHGADLLAVNGDGNMPFDICEDEATLDFIESQMVKRGITQEMIDVTRASTEVQMISDLEKLVAKGGDMNAPINDEGATALHVAAANGYLSVVKFLLNNAVNVNACDKDLWQPLHGVACWGNEQHSKVVALLVESGANLFAKTINDETVFDLCDNINLLETLNQLKDDLESKQSSDTNTLKRTQSRTNSRVHSVRRTSVRDKNQISRREAREEALLRVESETSATPATLTNTSSGSATLDQNNALDRANGSLKDQVTTLSNGVRSQPNVSSLSAEKLRTNGQVMETDLSVIGVETHRSQKTSSKSILNSGVEFDATDSKEALTNTTGANNISSEHQDGHHHVDDTICNDPNCAQMAQQQTSSSEVQSIPINYTLSNLKKHRSDLRMRTIGNGSSASLTTVAVKGNISSLNGHHQQVPVNRQISSAPTGMTTVISTDSRTNSPNLSYMKFYGEPSEAIGSKMSRGRSKCCIII